MKSAMRVVEVAYAKSWWVRASRRKRIIWAAVFIVEAGVLFALAGMLIDQVSAWIAAGLGWLSCCAFFGGLAMKPSKTARFAVRTLFWIFVLGAVGFVALAAGVFLAR